MKIKSLTVAAIVAFAGVAAKAQEATPSPTPQAGFRQQVFKPPSNDPLSKTKEEQSRATDEAAEYEASLRRLLAVYQDSARRAEEALNQAQKLFADGLTDKREVEHRERAVADANLKVSELQKQISKAESELPHANLSTSYDRFTDITTVWVPYYDLDVSSHHDLSIMAFVMYHGKDSAKPENMGIGFMATPHEIESPEISELYVLADGERISLGRPSGRSTKVGFKYQNTITEFLEYKATPQILKKIAYARKVEMRLGSFEFDLHQGFLRSMQKLISGIPNPQTAPPSTKRRTPVKTVKK